MFSAPIALADNPDSRRRITEAIFGHTCNFEHYRGLGKYLAYYIEELELLRRGISVDSWQTKYLAVKTCEDLFHIVDLLRGNGASQRPAIRQVLLLRFPSENELALNRSINLAIRLWLMVNTQEPKFEGLRHEANSVQWNDCTSLREFLQSLFPPAKWHVTAQSSRLGSHFTAAFMQDVCGLTIEWTTSLHDHLYLDRRRKALRIFPYKCHLQALIDCHRNSGDRER